MIELLYPIFGFVISGILTFIFCTHFYRRGRRFGYSLAMSRLRIIQSELSKTPLTGTPPDIVRTTYNFMEFLQDMLLVMDGKMDKNLCKHLYVG